MRLESEWYGVRCPRTGYAMPLFRMGSPRGRTFAGGVHLKCVWCPRTHHWSGHEIVRLRPQEVGETAPG